jgi:hypothetical protein
MFRYRGKDRGVLLRALGTAMLALAHAGFRTLRGWAVAGPIDGNGWTFLLAMATFLLGTAGVTLTALGHHIFDQIRISRRWQRQGDGNPGSAT